MSYKWPSLRFAVLAALFHFGATPSFSANAPIPWNQVKPLVETARQQHDRLTFASKWSASSRPDFAAFQQWVDRYLQAPNATARQALLAEGTDLATKRRIELLNLIKTDPSEAIASTVPQATRSRLPREIVALLEKRVEGRGDLLVSATMPPPGAHGPYLVLRTIKIDGVSYHAYVYGRRQYQATKYQLPLSGIAIDDQLALGESPLRLWEPGDKMPAGSSAIPWTRSDHNASNSVVVQVGAQAISVASPADVAPLEAALVRNESALGPQVSDTLPTVGQTSTQAVAASSWSLGNKQVLVIRVDFSDLPGTPLSDGTGSPTLTQVQAAGIMNSQINPFYTASSFNQTSLTTTVSSTVYRMPQTASFYAVNGDNDDLHSDAENLAAANFTLANYDRIIVVFANLGSLAGSQITYGGLADIGAKRVWINGFFDLHVLAHELGHTYGLNHANLWQVSDGDPVSANGTSIEYGDTFDEMGSATGGHFNPWDKYQIQWLTDANVTTVTSNGTYRVNRFDGADGTGVRALKIFRDSTRNYWIGLRKITGESLMSNSAYIIWGYNTPQKSNLLDTQTPGNSVTDAGLAVGKTLSDSVANVSIKTVDEGGASGAEYLDILVTFSVYTLQLGAFPPNGGTQTGAGDFAPGSSRTVTAAPASGFVFTGWTDNGTVVSTLPGYTFTLSGPRTLVANYYPTTAMNWLLTGSSGVDHEKHTATLLNDGRVLIAAGVAGGFLTTSAELYDPVLHGWSIASDLPASLEFHTASLLGSGQVLVAGGSSGGSSNAAESYDPASDIWNTANNLLAARSSHTATVLNNGQVLVAGGIDASSAAVGSAELYDPSTGNWAFTGSLVKARSSHTATLLNNGQVLIAAGEDTNFFLLTSAELYDPVAKTWSSTGSLGHFYIEHTATLLTNGKVLVAGGVDSQTNAELYDPATKQWTVTGSLNVGRYTHTATLLPDGKVLVSGGFDASGVPIPSAEIYDPATGTWTMAPNMNVARAYHTATLLANGQVLVAGGEDASGTGVSSAELFFYLTVQTIANFPPTLSVSQNQYTLPASTSANLPLVYTVLSGPGTVSGNTLTFNGLGSVVVQATQAGNNAYAALTQNETITNSSGVSFHDWQVNYGISGTPSDTPLGDGIPNLLKFLYDINPTRPMTPADSAALPSGNTDTTTTPGSTYLTLKYRKYGLGTGAAASVQISSDLVTWTTIPTNQLGINRVLKTDPVSGDQTIEVGVLETSPKQFIRLAVTGS